MSYQIDRVRFYIPPKGAKTQRKVSDISLTDNMLVINCGSFVEGLDLRTGERYGIETGLPNVGRIASRGGFLYLTDRNYSKLVRYDLRARHSDVIDSFPAKTAVFSFMPALKIFYG